MKRFFQKIYELLLKPAAALIAGGLYVWAIVILLENDNWLGISALTTMLLAIAAFWNISRDIKRGQPNIKVTIKHAYQFFKDDTPTQHFICVDVSNRGQQRIRINSFGFIFSDGKLGLLNNAEFDLPRYVESQDSIQLLYTEEHIKKFREKDLGTKKNVKFLHVSDSVGRVYKCKIPRDIKRFLIN